MQYMRIESAISDLQNLECKAPTNFDPKCVLQANEINWLVNKVRDLVTNEPIMRDVDPPVMIVG